MKSKSLVIWLVSLALVLASLSACSNAAAQESNFPSGKFRLADDRFSGFDFNEDGTWMAFYAGENAAEGTFSVKGDLYTEETNPDTDIPGGSVCSDKATYRYTFDGTSLSLSLVGEDTCPQRRGGLDGVTYVLSD